MLLLNPNVVVLLIAAALLGFCSGWLVRRRRSPVRVTYSGGQPYTSLMFESPTGDASDFAAQMARELNAWRTGPKPAEGGALARHGSDGYFGEPPKMDQSELILGTSKPSLASGAQPVPPMRFELPADVRMR